MKYWLSQTPRIGLTGAYSPYSLRYTWAQDAIRHYLAQGFSGKEALAQIAMDLGHGDLRENILIVWACKTGLVRLKLRTKLVCLRWSGRK
jgi:hypothetical protein